MNLQLRSSIYDYLSLAFVTGGEIFWEFLHQASNFCLSRSTQNSFDLDITTLMEGGYLPTTSLGKLTPHLHCYCFYCTAFPV